MIDSDRLDEVISYNADTGIFTWISSGSCRIKYGDIAGSVKKHGYREIQVDKKIYLAHRLAWLYYYGSFPDGEIDHINHNKLDNRIVNLRVVDIKENNKNKSIMKNNTSGHCGVVWHKKSSKWQSQIVINGKNIYLGLFKELFCAIKTRKKAEVKYGFHKNHGGIHQ
jgi:hypothetical protein